MLEFLRDQIWTFVGVMLTAILAIGGYRLGKQKKKLSYTISSSIPQLSVAKDMASKVTMSYENELVKQLHLLEIVLTNSGDIPIVSKDYETPLQIIFSEKAHVLSTEISGTSPKGINPLVKTDDHKVLIEPGLLNATDSFTLKLLVAEFDEELDIYARIVGVKKVEKKVQSFWRKILPGAISYAAVSLIFSLVFYWTSNISLSQSFIMGFGMMFLILIIVIANSLIDKLFDWFSSRD